MSQLIVIEPDQELAERIGTSLAERIKVSWRPVPSIDALAILEDTEPRVIVIGPGVSQAAALEFAEGLSEAKPDIGTLLIANEVSTELLRLALRSGLSDVVAVLGDDLTELQSAFAATLQRGARMRAPSADEAVPIHHALVLTVLSSKGGVGKSVIASNLAISLAKLGKSTALVDLDLKSGDLGIMLQLKPNRTIADAAMDCERLDEEMMRGFLVEHSSGVHVLLSPPRVEDVTLVSAPRLSRILDLLANIYEVVVIDTPSQVDDCVMTAVDKSDLVYLVATMDVASVRDARLALQRLKSLGYPDGSVRLLLNRADSRVFLEPAEVERAIGLPISARIPSDRLVPRSVNKGVPVVIEAPRSAVARSLAEIALSIAREGGQP